ncbi:MAG: hypothetical protein JO317_00320 [Verrucomicrobiae bacterium]|nr:hypothetical protein [Verrucomicrobiae bacterium]
MALLIRKILLLIVAFAIAIVVGKLIGEGSFFFLVALLSGLMFVFFLQSPAIMGVVCVMLYYSGLTAPGIPGKLNIFYLCTAALVVLPVLQMAMQRLPRIEWSTSHTWMALFGAVLLTTMLVRGAGFRALGSETWGGMFYVQLFLGMFLVFALPLSAIPAKWWPRAILFMGLFGLLPLAADAAILLGAPPSLVWSVIQGSSQIGQSMAAQTQVQSGVVRYFSAGPAGQLLLVGFLSVVRLTDLLSLHGLWLLPLPIAFFGITLLGGYRLAILSFGLTLLIVAMLQRSFTIGRIFAGIALAVGLWVALVQTSAHLPQSVQRAVSWIPGTDIPEYIRQDASSTVDWRLELWREALSRLPKYWLVGKGYAFSEKKAEGVTGVNRMTDELAWALETSSYHNGPISLLIGLGVFGLVFGSALMVSILVRHGRRVRAPWAIPRLHQCHQVIYAMTVAHVLIFFTIYGDVQISFPPLLFMFALLEGLCAADNQEFAVTRRRERLNV